MNTASASRGRSGVIAARNTRNRGRREGHFPRAGNGAVAGPRRTPHTVGGAGHGPSSAWGGGGGISRSGGGGRRRLGRPRSAGAVPRGAGNRRRGGARDAASGALPAGV